MKVRETQKYHFLTLSRIGKNFELQPKLAFKNPNIPSLSSTGKILKSH